MSFGGMLTGVDEEAKEETTVAAEVVPTGTNTELANNTKIEE